MIITVIFSTVLTPYAGAKLNGVDKHISMLTVLGDPDSIFFDNGFSNVDETKLLWSGQKRKEMPNSFTCIAPFFVKRPIKEGFYNTVEKRHIYCYTHQLCDRAEIANRSQNKP